MSKSETVHAQYHSYGQYDHCPECRAERAEMEAEREREHDAEIDQLTCDFITQATDACTAVTRLRATVERMNSPQVYDIEIAEGPGSDVLADLDNIARGLRHVARIAQWRRDLALKTDPAAKPAPDDIECGLQDETRKDG